jgi:hypothetical protein
MGQTRKFVGAFVIAALMSVALSADDGAPGGSTRSTCGFLQGILYKVGSPDVVGAIFEAVFDCDLDY